MFGTKEAGWSAEEEVRIVTDKFGMQSLVPSALHGIIFGSEMSDDNKKKIKDALKDKNVSFYQLQRKKIIMGMNMFLMRCLKFRQT